MNIRKSNNRIKKQRKKKNGMRVDKRPTDIQNAIIKRSRRKKRVEGDK